MAYGIAKSLQKPHLYLERRPGGMVAVRCSWMLLGVRWGSGSKIFHVLRAPMKY